MASRGSRSRATPFNPKEWARFADRAIAEIDASKFGDRVQTYMTLGAEFGLEHSVVRRIVAARRFITRIADQHPELANHLLAVPYPTIDPFRRWYDYDKEQAVAAAWEAVNGKRSIRSLRASEKSARRPTSIAEMSVKEREDYAIEIIEKDLPKGYQRAPLDTWAGSAIDCIFEFSGKTGKRDERRVKYALMVLGPFANVRVYDHRRADMLLAAAGAIYFGFEVIVTVAEPQAYASYLKALRDVGLHNNVKLRLIEA